MPEDNRAASALSTSPMGTTATAPATARAAEAEAARLGWRGAAAVSTSVFQAAHDGHCPAHLGEEAPHCWQT